MGLSGGAYDDTIGKSYVSGSITVGTTQVQAKAGASNLAGRQEMLIFNDGAKTIYFGPSGVTASGATKGIPIENGETISLPFTDSINVFLITAAATSEVIIQELA